MTDSLVFKKGLTVELCPKIDGGRPQSPLGNLQHSRTHALAGFKERDQQGKYVARTTRKR